MLPEVVMSFRDHAIMASNIVESTSVKHGLMNSSVNNHHVAILFDNITECPGHRASMNILTREHLCKVWNLTPGELIDTMGWAMDNPCDPVIVESPDAECKQNSMETVDITSIPVPWHYEQDRGRYMSASVIIAERNGERNMSFHRQFVAGKNRLVARLVPRHLRQFTDEARADNEVLNICLLYTSDAADE